jgi:hypothetical protein
VAGNANFPTSLDDTTSLFDVTDGSTTLVAAHHNNMRAAIQAIEAKIGILGTNAPTALDARIGHPTYSHDHSGASGAGKALSQKFVVQVQSVGSMASGVNRLRTAIPLNGVLESILGVARLGPSGATSVLDINFGATSLWYATQANRLMTPPGASVATYGPFNQATYTAGQIITVDADEVGSSSPLQDLSLVFVFRT